MMSFNFWTNKIIAAVAIFSSSIDQRERWTKISKSSSSYEEDMCVLFDDCAIELYIKNLKKMNIKDVYVDSISNLIDKINEMDSHLETTNKQEKVLEQQEWSNIRNLADKVIKNLKSMLDEIPKSE
jgi:hypothetical protein